MNINKQLLHYLMLIPGWRTTRKIVVIESDDWGSVRMPSKQIYNELLRKGVNVDKCPFSKYDSLERGEDLTALFETLQSVQDKYGSPAVITADGVVANPDFDRIENDDFNTYYYEPIIDTFNKYNGCENSFALYQQGINEKVWYPQFHGREHLNVNRWMKALRQRDEVTMFAFKQRHFGLSNRVSPKLNVRYMDAFGSVGIDSLKKEIEIIKEGTQLFGKLFGYKSVSFIAPCYTWRKEIEFQLLNVGIKYLQGLSFQQIPLKDEPLKFRSQYHYMGEKNSIGQRYLVRNAFFEPYKGGAVDYVGECLNRINIAFNSAKPAIISSHRINFIGSLDADYRDRNLRMLHDLLKRIVCKWPDVEFMTSDQLGILMDSKQTWEIKK